MGGAILSVLAAPASATMVEFFDYVSAGGWIISTATCDVNVGADCVLGEGNASAIFGGVRSKITWPEPPGPDFGTSSLTFWNAPSAPDVPPDGNVFGSGTVVVGAPPVVAGTFRHDNFVTDLGDELTSVVFNDLVQIAPSSGVLIGSDFINIPLLVEFFETPNDAAPCPAGDSRPCDDIFVVQNDERLTGMFTVCADETETDCWDYEFALDLEGLTTRPTAEMEAILGRTLDLADEDVGVIITSENASNTFVATLSVRHLVLLSEPGMLTLLGLGLVGLGLTWRRRRSV